MVKGREKGSLIRSRVRTGDQLRRIFKVMIVCSILEQKPEYYWIFTWPIRNRTATSFGETLIYKATCPGPDGAIRGLREVMYKGHQRMFLRDTGIEVQVDVVKSEDSLNPNESVRLFLVFKQVFLVYPSFLCIVKFSCMILD